MKRIFLDSDCLIDCLRGKEYTRSIIDRIQRKEFQAFVSVVTAFELYTGAFLSNNPKRR